MNYRSFEFRSTAAAFGIAVPFTAVVWLFAVAEAIGPMTFVIATLLALCGATVTVMAWRDGAGSLGQVAPAAAPVARAAKRPAGTR